MESTKVLFYCSSTLLFIGFSILIFSIFVFENLIASGEREKVILRENNIDSWGYLPGKSKVEVYQKFYIYNMKDLENIPFTN